MSKWIECPELENIRTLYRAHEYSAAEAECTDLIDNTAEGVIFDAVIGAFFLRAACRASLGKDNDACRDHQHAVKLIGEEIPPEERLTIASEAMESGLPLDYCENFFYETAMDFKQADVDPALTATAFNKLGVCRFRAEKTLEAETHAFEMANNAVETIKNPDADELILSALIKSNLAECLARAEDYEPAAELYRDASDIFEPRVGKSAVCTEQYAICQRNLSDIYRREDDNVQANRCITLAIEALENHPEPADEEVLSHLSSCFNSRGTMRYGIGDYSGEVDDCTRSLELREQINSTDYLGFATVYSNRAEAYAALEKWDETAADYQNAADKLKKLPKDNLLFQTLIAIWLMAKGRAHLAAEHFSEALEAFIEAAEFFTVVRGKEVENYSSDQLAVMEAHCRFFIATTARQEEHLNYHLAITELRTAIELLEELPPLKMRFLQLSSLHNHLGELYELFDEQELAEKEYGISEMLYAQHGDGIAYHIADEDEDADNDGEIWTEASDDIPQA